MRRIGSLRHACCRFPNRNPILLVISHFISLAVVCLPIVIYMARLGPPLRSIPFALVTLVIHSAQIPVSCARRSVRHFRSFPNQLSASSYQRSNGMRNQYIPASNHRFTLFPHAFHAPVPITFPLETSSDLI
jgi:hypothetical protein